ncbi:hypothetical protein GCM10009609_30730 [Pseudonocardia aurantiaca]|uniref:Uncharacterized protein n=1 Tax=Pseudonocardia aurantiaca TaxID=75290 RepID=A0ABW4FVB7_9PSEU
MDDPVMAVVRVKAPADIDPHVLEAELTRAIHWYSSRPMTAEVALLPTWRRRTKGGMRRHGFVAVLCAPTAGNAGELTRVAQDALRKSLRKRFGAAATAKVRPARSSDEIDTYWCSLRGTPHRF